MSEDRYISITALTRYLKRKLESDRHLQDVWLRGEISNFKVHSRGHMYLTLKDNGARIQSVMFAGYNKNLLFEPEDGMKVLVRGEIAVYEPYGQYQLYIKDMQQDGVGRLHLAFEALKKKLEAQGFFSPLQKKALPQVPYEVGVITSPTGAAVRDIYTTLKRRFPAVRITLFPVLVQGDSASKSIVQAIKQANKETYLDVLIVGRGGGSIEDLWPFNEEIVAQAIYESKLPIISAVGHETDFTISDFVADLRAATPTAAAELAVPNHKELKARIMDQSNRLYYLVKQKVNRAEERLDRLKRAYAFKYPSQLLRQKEQELDMAISQLTKAIERKYQSSVDQSQHVHALLLKHDPKSVVDQSKKTASALQARLQRSIQLRYQEKTSAYKHVVGQLHALSPLQIMARGYSLSYTEQGNLIKSVKDVQPGDPLKVKLTDGSIDCQIWGIEEGKIDE
ncbi:exodeoxyribonuclease VII large subunit [Terrilactibacillus sp. BCM23-1]|uniref:Exodeoxyribonuclease 7 large subunit n=1 Tax=Terrilactibacillus tamarindi TaxID=2599694 RepID=A0A6N8CR21_9BACI|nr:exodeoxyribonuclease VII large subunit [Terrilactibacillus tamarindi]MTT32689.1 exodeoxyribonuclease VII large subunit [Terrilactibacillus tamarindi]